MAQTFTRMDESTAEQWAVIGKETYEHQGRVAESVLAMLRSLAAITDGFAVDQLTHSLQTATRAERAGYGSAAAAGYRSPTVRRRHLDHASATRAAAGDSSAGRGYRGAAIRCGIADSDGASGTCGCRATC